jgi:NAD+ synthase
MIIMMHAERDRASLLQCLQFDPEKAKAEIVDFVRREAGRLGKAGAVIGLSGGLDSSTVALLLVEALGKDRVMGLVLPERDTSPENTNDAIELAESLGMPHEKIDISPILQQLGAYGLFREQEASSRSAMERSLDRVKRMTGKESPFAEMFGSVYSGEKDEMSAYVSRMHAFMTAKTRARMIVIFYHAILKDYFVAGTDDKSELTIGFYDKYGDGACDISLLSHLYKSQIKKLAAHIGVPARIVNKPSSHDLWGHNLPNEETIGLPYEKLDGILCGMSMGYSDAELAGLAGIRLDTIESIKRAIRSERVRRSMPFTL